MDIGKKTIKKISDNITNNIFELINSEILKVTDVSKGGMLYALYVPSIKRNFKKLIFNEMDDKTINYFSLYFDYIYIIIYKTDFYEEITVLYIPGGVKVHGCLTFADLLHYRNAIKHYIKYKKAYNRD